MMLFFEVSNVISSIQYSSSGADEKNWWVPTDFEKYQLSAQVQPQA